MKDAIEIEVVMRVENATGLFPRAEMFVEEIVHCQTRGRQENDLPRPEEIFQSRLVEIIDGAISLEAGADLHFLGHHHHDQENTPQAPEEGDGQSARSGIQ